MSRNKMGLIVVIVIASMFCVEIYLVYSADRDTGINTIDSVHQSLNLRIRCAGISKANNFNITDIESFDILYYNISPKIFPMFKTGEFVYRKNQPYRIEQSTWQLEEQRLTLVIDARARRMEPR